MFSPITCGRSCPRSSTRIGIFAPHILFQKPEKWKTVSKIDTHARSGRNIYKNFQLHYLALSGFTTGKLKHTTINGLEKNLNINIHLFVCLPFCLSVRLSTCKSTECRAVVDGINAEILSQTSSILLQPNQHQIFNAVLQRNSCTRFSFIHTRNMTKPAKKI